VQNHKSYQVYCNLDFKQLSNVWKYIELFDSLLIGLGWLCENPIVDSVGQNNRPMR